LAAYAQRPPSPILGAIDQRGSQCIPLDVAAHNKEVLVVLDGKALVSLLVNMPLSTSTEVSVIAYRMRATYPSHRAAHLSIDEGSQNEVIAIGQIREACPL
jgi:hypothetical protein